MKKCLAAIIALALSGWGLCAQTGVRPVTNEILIQNGHSGSVQTLEYSPDGRILATGSIDGTVKLWETASGRLLATLTGHSADFIGNEVRVAFSPDGRTLASGSRDSKIILWEASSGKWIPPSPW